VGDEDRDGGESNSIQNQKIFLEKCHSPHIMDADLLMQTIAEVLKKIEDYSISNRAEFEALVKKNLPRPKPMVNQPQLSPGHLCYGCGRYHESYGIGCVHPCYREVREKAVAG
jgi:molybdopterin/thiamine biosynthesis adenylyltransferase